MKLLVFAAGYLLALVIDAWVLHYHPEWAGFARRKPTAAELMAFPEDEWRAFVGRAFRSWPSVEVDAVVEDGITWAGS